MILGRDDPYKDFLFYMRPKSTRTPEEIRITKKINSQRWASKPENKEKIKEYTKNHKENHKKAMKKYYDNFSEEKTQKLLEKQRERQQTQEYKDWVENYKLENSDKVKESSKKYYETHKVEKSKYAKEWYIDGGKQKQNNTRRKRIFNLSPEDYDKIEKEQNFVCAICKKSEIRINKNRNFTNKLSVDHDHITGKVRGLLCHACNAGIGLLRENIENLENAINYLNKNKI